MCVVSADIPAFMATHFLQTHPDIGLHVADQMAKMNGTVGVGQGAGNENFAWHGGERRERVLKLADQFSKGAIELVVIRVRLS